MSSNWNWYELCKIWFHTLLQLSHLLVAVLYIKLTLLCIITAFGIPPCRMESSLLADRKSAQTALSCYLVEQLQPISLREANKPLPIVPFKFYLFRKRKMSLMPSPHHSPFLSTFPLLCYHTHFAVHQNRHVAVHTKQWRYDLALRLILVVKTTVALANDHGLLDMMNLSSCHLYTLCHTLLFKHSESLEAICLFNQNSDSPAMLCRLLRKCPDTWAAVLQRVVWGSLWSADKTGMWKQTSMLTSASFVLFVICTVQKHYGLPASLSWCKGNWKFTLKYETKKWPTRHANLFEHECLFFS